MFKHILVPTDGSKLSLKALDLAAGVASATHAKVSVLYVSPSYPTMIGGDGYMVTPMSIKDWDISIAKGAARVREQVEKRAGAKSVAVVVIHGLSFRGRLEIGMELQELGRSDTDPMITSPHEATEAAEFVSLSSARKRTH